MIKDSTTCSLDAYSEFSKMVKEQNLHVNALLVVNAILTGVMVGIGAYGHRYRYRPLTRILYLSATALFLPIVSYVATAIDNQQVITIFSGETTIIGRCDTTLHFVTIMIWTALVQIAGVHTSAVVASDAREGRNVGPPVVLLVQAIWTSYLAISILEIPTDHTYSFSTRFFLNVREVFSEGGLVLLLPFVIILAKLILRYYAWYKARQSVALGCITRLIIGYMEKLQEGSHDTELNTGEHMHIPPPLIVMGEDAVLLEEQPHGYNFNTRTNTNALVTIDRIWELNDMLIQRSTPTPQLKDICLSFALFKLLRCRFARYTIVEAGFLKARNFLWSMLEDCDDGRIFGVIEYELSFLHDYYYSSFPISYSKSWLPVLNIFTSLVTISYCLWLSAAMLLMSLEIVIESLNRSPNASYYQLKCVLSCDRHPMYKNVHHTTRLEDQPSFGNMQFDTLTILVLLASVILAEFREIASYICSNWTKVTLACRYISNTSWQQSPILQKCIGCILQRRCKLFKHWEGKMNQCSILVLRPRRTPMALLRRLIAMPDGKMEVPRAVKAAILHTLRSYDERSRSNGVASLPSSLRVGNNLIWEFNGTKGTAHAMLVCHIATSILEVRMRSEMSPSQQQHLSDHKIAATHLSHYCAYLVAHCPELLPDDDGWCKKLYKTVKKDADRVHISSIAVSRPEEEYQQLVELLGTKSKHEVLKNGTDLGKRLAELAEEEAAAAWRVLSGFWSEMLLYVALSEYIDGHAEATARGGELITLLWALLAHLGITRRANDAAATAPGGIV